MTEKQKFFKWLYEGNYIFLLRIARIFVINEADAEDLVQEVFIRAMNAYDKLVNHQNPRAWLVATLKYCIRNDSRQLSKTLNVSLENMDELTAPEDMEPLSHILPAELSPRDRELILWRFEQELSYQEISRRLGISEMASRVKVCRVIKKCRGLMSK